MPFYKKIKYIFLLLTLTIFLVFLTSCLNLNIFLEKTEFINNKVRLTINNFYKKSRKLKSITINKTIIYDISISDDSKNMLVVDITVPTIMEDNKNYIEYIVDEISYTQNDNDINYQPTKNNTTYYFIGINTNTDEFRFAKNLNVKIFSNETLGTGVIYSYKKLSENEYIYYVITSGHLGSNILKNDNFNLRYKIDTKEISFSISKKDIKVASKGYDISVISFKAGSAELYALHDFLDNKVNKKTDDKILLNQPIVGFKFVDFKQEYSIGSITNLTTRSTYTSNCSSFSPCFLTESNIVLGSGSSGGAIFTSNNELVGIITSKSLDDKNSYFHSMINIRDEINNLIKQLDRQSI